MFDLSSILTNGLISVLIGPISLYYFISLIAYFLTTVEERRLELAGEITLDSLRTWSLSVKQTATLTNMKIYQSGVFLFGKKRRSVVIPLKNIDSVEIASGRNYVWMALSVSTILSLLYHNTPTLNSSYSYGSYSYLRDPVPVTIALIMSAIFFGIFWVGGSRRIIVRAKTAKIVVEASVFSLSTFSPTVGDSRIFSFANRIQSMIVVAHDLQKLDAPDPYLGIVSPVGVITKSDSHKCSSCGAALLAGSRFCEGCGIPVS